MLFGKNSDPFQSGMTRPKLWVEKAMAKARFGGDKTEPNPTDRAKPGTKRSILVEADGGLLAAAIIGGANVHSRKLLEATLDAIVVERPKLQDIEQHLCLDKGFSKPTSRDVVDKHY
jgi:hypothetical protein